MFEEWNGIKIERSENIHKLSKHRLMGA